MKAENFETTEFAELEVAIRSDLSVLDCVVLVRSTDKHEELVAYVVPLSQFSPKRLLSHLQTVLPSALIPTSLVQVSALPLSASGQIDEAALTGLSVNDSDLEQRWERQLQLLPEVEQVAVIVKEQTKRQPSLHLSDLIPDWNTVTSKESRTPITFEFPRSAAKQEFSSSKSAINYGGELKRETDSPLLLWQILKRAVLQKPEKGLVYIQPDGSEIFQTYKDLLLDAQQILAGLKKLGLKSSDKVIFQIDRSQDFIPAFWGCVLGGFVPVPISMAPTYEQANSTVNKLYNAWQILERPIVLASSGLAESIRSLSALFKVENFQVETVDNLRRNKPDRNIYQSQPDDLALLLLTSGSTGLPKGVMLSHRNLLSMTAGTAQMNCFSSKDITLNWMPLDHVGAIVFLGLMAIDLNCKQIHVPTEFILQNPIRLLELIQQHQATISWAPNFAFSLINQCAEQIKQRSWDLSSMRFLVNAGEQIVVKTARTFLKLLQPYGLSSNAIHPAFGMSETCSGITWSDGFSLEASSDDMSFVELGFPIPGASIRVADENNQVVTEGVIGRFQVKGLSVTSGYYQNPERNRETFCEDGWFDTGDLGYLQSGRIVLTGRNKDDIIINGINYYSHDIESVVEEVEGVEVSYTAACAVRFPSYNFDQLAIFFSSAISDQNFLKELIKKIRGAVVKNVGVNPNYIIPVEKEVIPKTAIGKIQRNQLSKSFEAGKFDSIIQQLGIHLKNPNLLPHWFYRKIWRRKVPVTLMPSSQMSHFLIFLDPLGLGECLATELEKQGQPWVGVEVGVDFAQLGNNRYQIAPNNPDHYRRLLSALASDNFQLDKILHLWTYDERISEISSLHCLEQAQIQGVYSLLFLTQALAKIQEFKNSIRLLVVSSYTQFTSPTDEIAYEKSPLIGLLKTISQEMPALTSRHVDLTVDPASVNVAYILQEIQVLSGEQEVAYRQGQRWVPCLEKVDFHQEEKQDIPLKQGGMYLISGGLGAVGVEIAKYLLKHFKARLLLIGRSPLPERSTWQTHIGQTDAVSQKIKAYQELEELGGEISYQTVDVCNLIRLQQAIEEAKSRWHCQLDGVFHLAGDYYERSLVEETQESWSAALLSKVGGAWVLNQLLKNYPESVFISFSSISSFFGGATVGAFTAANQFLESFSHYQRSKCAMQSYCLSWSIWDGIGISRNYQRKNLAQTKGYCAMTTNQGVYSLLLGLLHDQAQLLVGLDGSNEYIRGHIRDSYSLEKLTAYFTTSSNPLPVARLQELVVQDRFGSPSTCDFVQIQQMPLTQTGVIEREKLISGDLYGKSGEGAQPLTEVERQVAIIWQEVLGFEEVGIHDNFFELGGHSLLLVQAQNKLQEYFGTQLSIVDMFKYPTINTLANYLSQEQTEQASAQQGQKRAKLRSSRKAAVDNLGVAVIGMACRFPGANNINEFWQNLRDGVESISFFTDKEILASGVDPKLLKNPNYVKASPILSDVEFFDAGFFGYSVREAELMDPQHRLLMECAWESLETAGYNPTTYKGSIGMYAGASMNTYLLNNIYPNRHQLDANDALQVTTLDSMGGFQMMVANDKDYLTTRVSYKLNLSGPSVNVQTACSTSLVAVHMASQSLMNGECDMVLAGGVSVQVPQKIGHLYQEGMIVSSDGHCRAFDTRAQGTIFGSGVGLVVLKRFEDAIADGDFIYAVIKGSALNNDGGMKVGYMAPNGDGQAAATSEALEMAGVEAESITYVEAHGTGTPLGDPIEIGGLTQAFRASTQKKNFCAVGSVKTNVGHLQIASGIAGFIKTVLALQHKQLPASLHFEQPNPQIDFANSPFYVNTTLSKWQKVGYPRRAGVNSLGIGGANVHVILEEAPETAIVNNGVEHPAHLLTLSAKNEKALQELACRYEKFLESHPETSLADVCFTANTGRADFDYRLALAAKSTQLLREQLGAFTASEQIDGLRNDLMIGRRPSKIVFLFTGQGAQYVNMGRQLYETQPMFRQILDQCDEILRSYLDKSLIQVLYPGGQSSLIDETAYTQPILFALEYAIAELWKSWGVEPDVVMGHSVGEYVAACVAGVFSLEDGLKLIAERGRLMQALPQNGEMVVVFADEAQIAPVIQLYTQKVSIAAVNGPQNTVISGERQAVRRIVVDLEAQGVETRQLEVSHAFHSPLMQPMLAAFKRIASEVTFSLPQINLISNVTGELCTALVSTPEYWCQHVLQPVKFDVGMRTLQQQGYKVFVECGPKSTLLGMGRNCISNTTDAAKCIWLPSLSQIHLDCHQMLQSLGELYVTGLSIDWSGFYRDYPRRRLPVPTYPFQRQRYWIETVNVAHHKAKTLAKVRGKHFHPLLGQRLQSALNVKETVFESWLSCDAITYLKHHCVYQTAILPAAAYLEMALAAGAAVFKSQNLVIEDFVILQALILPEDKVQTVQLILTPSDVQVLSFQIYSLVTDEEKEESFWKLHTSGNIAVQKQDSEAARVDLGALRTRCTEELSVEVYYQQYRERDIDYGSSFQTIEQLWRHEGEALGQIRLSEALVLEAGNYKLHPVLLDACFQVSRAAFPEWIKQGTYLPVGMERMSFWGLNSSTSHTELCLWSHVRVHNFEAKDLNAHLSILSQDSSANSSSTVQETITIDLRLFDENGVVVAEIEGISLKRASRETLLQGNLEKPWQDWLYEVEWRLQAYQGQQLPPDYLHNPKEIRNLIGPLVANVLPQSDEAVLTQVEALSVAYVLSAFEQMGWKFQQGKSFSAVFIAEQLNVVSQHRRLLSRLLEMLAEVGILQQINKQWEVAVMSEMPDLQKQISTLLVQYPQVKAQLTMLERCGSKLATVLRGECDPIQLLFPESDLETATQIYQDSPDAQVMNTLVQKAISSALEDLPKKRRVRVLEIGAGTGGTTSYILPHLSPYQTEYVFTDASPLFTTKAQEKFQDYPFVRYQILNIEQEPKLQGFGEHQYDLIVAANVLHATSDLRQTLQHVNTLLAPGGVLVLLEGTRRQRWLDLIFGLTEGWWKFTDLDLRPNYPLLSANRWQELLLEMGFKDIVTIPSAQQNQGVLSQQTVIVSQAAQTLSEKAVLESRNWLIFADAQGIGQQLSVHLQSKGDICTLVFPGKKYEQSAKQEFRVDPAKLSDFQRLLEAVDTDKPLHGVVHLWSLDTVEAETLTSFDLKMAFQQGCGSTLHLIQALVGSEFSEPPSLWLVTQGAVSVKIPASKSSVSIEHISGVAQSSLWGMGKVIAKEHPELRCVRVDLGLEAREDKAQALFEEIWLEAKEDQVALRNQSRYVARLVHSPQAQDVTEVRDRLHFHGNSTYLVTGGLGGLGLLVTHWMVKHGARHLVLVGRSGASSADSNQIRELEQAGAKIVVLKADISEAEQVAWVLAEIEHQSLPPLRGIINCVGVLDDGTLRQQSWERFERVMTPKVQGSWNLHTLTQNLPLDFFVLFSSVASLLGSPGQANHAAANAFLDALAYYRSGQGLPGLSINWGAVAEVGAAAQRQAGEWLKTQGIGTIAPQQVLNVLEQLFSQSSVQVGIVPINWSQFTEQSSTWPFLADFQQASEQFSKQRLEFLQQLESTSITKRRSLLVAYVCSEVAKVLGLNSSQLIELQQGFFELGMDSLTSVELRNRLQNSLACKLPSTIAFDYPTVETLVDYLIQEVLTLEFSSKSGIEIQKSKEVDDKAELLAELSQDEIADLLAKKLANLN